MKVEILRVTPSLAKEWLNKNHKNRKVNNVNLKFLISEMENGRWMDNGASISFDVDNNLIDGQHRLLAIIDTGMAFDFSIVTGLSPDTFATFDTGKIRSAPDVLGAEGYSYSSNKASFISAILTGNKERFSFKSAARQQKLSNAQVLDYCIENNHWIEPIIMKSYSINTDSKPRILSTTQIAYIAYMIGGQNPSEEVYDFLSNICGVNRNNGTATNYVFKKLYEAKTEKIALHFNWIMGMTIKAWNLFIFGNPPVSFMRFNVNDKLPKIKQLN